MPSLTLLQAPVPPTSPHCPVMWPPPWRSQVQLRMSRCPQQRRALPPRLPCPASQPPGPLPHLPASSPPSLRGLRFTTQLLSSLPGSSFGVLAGLGTSSATLQSVPLPGLSPNIQACVRLLTDHLHSDVPSPHRPNAYDVEPLKFPPKLAPATALPSLLMESILLVAQDKTLSHSQPFFFPSHPISRPIGSALRIYLD